MRNIIILSIVLMIIITGASFATQPPKGEMSQNETPDKKGYECIDNWSVINQTEVEPELSGWLNVYFSECEKCCPLLETVLYGVKSYLNASNNSYNFIFYHDLVMAFEEGAIDTTNIGDFVGQLIGDLDKHKMAFGPGQPGSPPGGGGGGGNPNGNNQSEDTITPYKASTAFDIPNSFLLITSNPEYASILIDGNSRGKTNGKWVVSPGKHNIQIRFRDKISQARTVEIHEGETFHVHFE